LSPKQVLTVDLTADDIDDYCFIGDVDPIVYVWRLKPNCAFEAVPFLQRAGDRTQTTAFLEGFGGVEVKKGVDGAYLLGAWEKVPFQSKFTEDVYRWSSAMQAFVMSRKHEN
jgi:hypothetical protein